MYINIPKNTQVIITQIGDDLYKAKVMRVCDGKLRTLEFDDQLKELLIKINGASNLPCDTFIELIEVLSEDL